MNPTVLFDPENGDLILSLPPQYQSYQEELYARLAEQFLDSAMDESALARMNRFVEHWLQENAPD